MHDRSVRAPEARDAPVRALALLAVLSFAWWGGTLSLPLHQDDFLLAAGPHGPWRAAFVSLIRGLWLAARSHPEPFHAVVLALHVAAAWLLFRLAIAVGASRGAALAAAAAFAASSTHAYSFYNVASGADVAAAVPLLGAALAAVSGRSLASAGLFALALLCKETVALVPLAFPLLPGRARGRVPWPHLAVAAAWIAILRLTHGLVTQQFGHLYVAASPGDVLRNLAGYATAAVDWFGLLADPYRNVPRVSLPLLALAAALPLYGITRRDARPAAWLAVAWFVAAIAPVTLTSTMFVRYYLYVPLCGVLLLAARLATVARAPAAALAAGVAVLLGGSAYALARLEGARLPGTDVHAQSSLRHAQVAGHALADVAGTPLGRYTVLALPLRYPAVARANHGWYDRNVVVAISDGRALALACPDIVDIEPARRGDPYTGWTRVMLAWDGHVRAVVPAGP